MILLAVLIAARTRGKAIGLLRRSRGSPMSDQYDHSPYLALTKEPRTHVLRTPYAHLPSTLVILLAQGQACTLDGSRHDEPW